MKTFLKLKSLFAAKSQLPKLGMEEPVNRVVLEDLEESFSELIEHFRMLGKTADAGYAADRAGYGYFDLTQNEDGLTQDLCLYFEEWTFRVSGTKYQTDKIQYHVEIIEYDGDTKNVTASNRVEIEKIIYALINKS